MEMTEMDDGVVARAKNRGRHSKKLTSDDKRQSAISSVQEKLEEPEKRYPEGGGWVERRSRSTPAKPGRVWQINRKKKTAYRPERGDPKRGLEVSRSMSGSRW